MRSVWRELGVLVDYPVLFIGTAVYRFFFLQNSVTDTHANIRNLTCVHISLQISDMYFFLKEFEMLTWFRLLFNPVSVSTAPSLMIVPA